MVAMFGTFHRLLLANVTFHGIATVAMWAIRNFERSARATPTKEDVIALINNVNNVEYPGKADELADIRMMLLRLWHLQFPYQEEVGHLLPRYLILFLETHPADPVIDIDQEFSKIMGLSVKEFMTLGLAAYARGLNYDRLERSYLHSAGQRLFNPPLPADKVEIFIGHMASEFREFKRLCIEEEKSSPNAGPYVFNPLWVKPIVILPDGALVMPVPRLLIHRITKGLYYDLLEAYREPAGNQFAVWFGHAFEEYAGIVLKASLGEDKVFGEPLYGRVERAGPDWVVVDGEHCLALECRSSRLKKSAKTGGDYEEVLTLIRRAIIETAAKLPQKIKDLRDGATGVNTSGVTTYLPAIVTAEPWYPEPQTLAMVREHLMEMGLQDFRFELMSVGDLERLAAWIENGGSLSILQEKLADRNAQDITLGSYLNERAPDLRVPQVPNRLLMGKMDSYFNQLVTEMKRATPRDKAMDFGA